MLKNKINFNFNKEQKDIQIEVKIIDSAANGDSKGNKRNESEPIDENSTEA